MLYAAVVAPVRPRPLDYAIGCLYLSKKDIEIIYLLTPIILIRFFLKLTRAFIRKNHLFPKKISYILLFSEIYACKKDKILLIIIGK